MDLFVPLAVLVLMLLARMSVGLAMAISGFVGLTMSVGMDPALSAVQNHVFSHPTSLLLTTVPMFILMAEFLSHGRIVKQIFDATSAWVGHIRGGLAVSVVLANAGFAALSGSTTAAAAAIARTSVPRMRELGYDDRLSVGTVAAAGTLAATIPPSIGLIVYGVQTETSISKLFIAGIIPGLFTAVFFMLVVIGWVRLKPELAGQPVHASWGTRFATSVRAWPALILVVVLIGSIYAGIVTPTEAGALGAAAALALSVTLGGLRFRGMVDAVENTIRSTSMILAIIIGAGIFGTFLSVTRVAPRLFDLIEGSGMPTGLVMLIVVLTYLVLGTFMDSVAMMVLTLPLTFPLVTALGFHPVWFGIVVVKCVEVGLITPPLGLNVFVAADASNTRPTLVFSGAWRFLIAEIAVIILLFAFPDIALYLPSHL